MAATDYNSVEPAQQTALGQQGSGMLPREWMPQRGLVLRSSTLALPADACTVAQNVRWNGKVWTTKKIGFAYPLGPGQFFPGTITEQAVHFAASGQEIYVHQAGTALQTLDPTNPGTTAASAKTIFNAASQTIPCMRSFAPNYFIYTNGVDVPQSWDGVASSTTPIACFPLTTGSGTLRTPKICETFNGRMVYSKFPESPFAIVITDLLQPGQVTLVAGTPNPVNGGIYYVPSRLGPVTTVKSIQISLTSNVEVLLVGCQRGFAIITGTDSTSFNIVPVQSGKWGMPSNRCWFTIDSTAFGMCSDGLRPFTGNAYLSNLVSRSITFPVHPFITNWNGQMYGESSFILDNSQELEAVFYCSQGPDPSNSNALIINYGDMGSDLYRFSTKYQAPIYTSPILPAQATNSCGVKFKDRYFTGTFNGQIAEQYTSNLFGGNGVPYLIGSPLLQASTPAQEGSAKGFYIMGHGSSSMLTANCYSYVPNAGGSQDLVRSLVDTQSFNLIANGSAKLGSTFVLGQGALGGSQYQLTPYYPAAAGRAMEVQLSGNTANGDLNLVGVFGIIIGGGTRF